MTHRAWTLLIALSFFAASPFLQSQHSAGGGGGFSSGSSSSGGSHSASSGGGSSGGYSGGHSSSSAGSSAGSVSHSSSGHGSSSSSGHASGSSSHFASTTSSNATRPVRQPESGVRGKGVQPSRVEPEKVHPEKRGFFAVLFHRHKPQPQRVVVLPHPPCVKGLCGPCPVGTVHGRGGCAAPHLDLTTQNVACNRLGEEWSVAGCVQRNRFLGNCNSLLTLMQQQEQRMRAAESTRASACSSNSPDCAELTREVGSEANLFRTYQAQYAQCMKTQGHPFAPSAQYGHTFLDPL